VSPAIHRIGATALTDVSRVRASPGAAVVVDNAFSC
jgi:hypothetical protein